MNFDVYFFADVPPHIVEEIRKVCAASLHIARLQPPQPNRPCNFVLFTLRNCSVQGTDEVTDTILRAHAALGDRFETYCLNNIFRVCNHAHSDARSAASEASADPHRALIEYLVCSAKAVAP
jgi:hypothetical protein